MSSRVTGWNAGRAAGALRLAILPMLILGSLGQRAHAAAAAPASGGGDGGAVDFDASFFPAGMAPKVDLARFEKSGYVAPGSYRVDIRVNEEWRSRTDITFAAAADSNETSACFDAAALTRYGIDLKKVAADVAHPAAKPIPTGEFCGPLGDYVKDATVSYDANAQVLSISVPQIYMSRSARGYVDPSQWDAGIDAAVVSYMANAYRSADHTSAYLGLNASLDLGSWHVFSLGSLSWSDTGGSHYQNSATYLQHDIPAWGAQLVLGDSFTSGDMFDSVRLRGARLYSDTRMLPQSQRGYAPVVHGIAQTNAKVTIRQNGYIIYEANVAPGPFAINDLYPTGYGGDLNVQVTEADGRIEQFNVPFSAVALLLRPGQVQWSVTAGQVNQQNLLNQPLMAQGTFQRGMTNRITGYTGATVMQGYAAMLVGGALNTEVGAFSADVTQARNETPGQRTTEGTSFRLGYNKNITGTGTDIGVAAYRYSTSGYVGLNDSIDMRSAAASGNAGAFTQRQRSRMDVSINQRIGERYGQVFLSSSMRDFWGTQGRQVDFSAGYSNQWHSISYSLTAQRTRDSVSTVSTSGIVNQIPLAQPTNIDLSQAMHRDTRLFFSISMPLGRAAKAPSFTALYNHSDSAGSNEQVSVNGALGENNRFSYGASMSHAAAGDTFDANGQYSSSSANVAASYSHGSGYDQLGASMSGSVIAHSGGLTFAPPTGETIGLIYAPDAEGAAVQNGQGSVVNAHGYAVVPNLVPYELNTITLDPKGTDAGVELKETTQSVAPRAGSVVRLKYATTSGRALMIESGLSDGRPVPFGADVFDDKGDKVGVVGQASRILVNGLKASGVITIRWGDDAGDNCRIPVEMPQQDKKHRGETTTLHATCAIGQATAAQLPEVTKPAVLKPVAALDAIKRYPGIYGTPVPPATGQRAVATRSQPNATARVAG